MDLNSKKFINSYAKMFQESAQINQNKKKKLIVKQYGAPIQDHPQPEQPEFDGGGAQVGACCGEQVETQDVSIRDSFQSKLYDLIDTVYALGHKAAQDGAIYPPLEDDEVSNILASIAASFDDLNLQ